MKKYVFNSEEDTKKFARDLAKSFRGGIIALSGGLGSGKTTFTQGFAKGLKIKDKIISPTFVLQRQHQIPNSRGILFHIDLYRLNSGFDLKNIGLNDMTQNPKNIIIIEWAEKAKNSLPKNIDWIYFKQIDINTREISLKLD